MRVITKQKAKWGLESLAHFLSLDLDSVNKKDLEGYCLLQVYLGGDLERSQGRGAAKRLQAEVRQYLLPIVTPERQFSAEEAYKLLWSLVERVNKTLRTPRWAILPVDYELYGDDTGKTITGSRRLEADEIEEESTYLRLGHRVITLLGYRWFVGLDPAGVGSLRDCVYAAIIGALESGELSRLRVCGECQKFFVQKDARQGFCSDECRIESNNRRRLESGYFSDLRHKKRERQLKKARRLLKEGKTAARVAEETGLPLRILRRGGLVE
jgi:hypothetical protein